MNEIEIKLACLDIAEGDLERAKGYFEWVVARPDTKYDSFEPLEWKRA